MPLSSPQPQTLSTASPASHRPDTLPKSAFLSAVIGTLQTCAPNIIPSAAVLGVGPSGRWVGLENSALLSGWLTSLQESSLIKS